MDKLGELNTIPVTGFSAIAGELEYVHVWNSQKVRDFLITNGVPEAEIDDMTSDDKKLIDISSIGFEYFGARWFQRSKGGFLDYLPHDVPEWCK